MNNPKLYTVKEAAKIVGVSTNTLYKYLDEDRIHAARGTALQGRFRIPESALEEFLGVKISPPEPTSLPDLPTDRATESLTDRSIDSPNIVNRAHLPLKFVRFLLILALIAILLDLFISRTVSLPGQLSRLLFLAVMLILAYQEGGYRHG